MIDENLFKELEILRKARENSAIQIESYQSKLMEMDKVEQELREKLAESENLLRINEENYQQKIITLEKEKDEVYFELNRMNMNFAREDKDAEIE